MLAYSERLIYMMGPSGAGKDSVLACWIDRLGPGAGVQVAQRVITRPAQPTGEQHEPVKPDAWEALRREGQLALHWQANGLGYGVRHAALAPLAEAERQAAVLAELEQVFPGCRADFERGLSVVWSLDPASRGAYSHFHPGQLTRFGPLLAEPLGPFVLAGEHTDPWQATMNGALASGERAARQVLAGL